MITDLARKQAIVMECSHLDDAPRRLIRGALLKVSEDCKKNRHRKCSSSHCSCGCHLQKMVKE